jgi:hypothetical protein
MTKEGIIIENEDLEEAHIIRKSQPMSKISLHYW